MLISNKIHYFRNFILQIYVKRHNNGSFQYFFWKKGVKSKGIAHFLSNPFA